MIDEPAGCRKNCMLLHLVASCCLLESGFQSMILLWHLRGLSLFPSPLTTTLLAPYWIGLSNLATIFFLADLFRYLLDLSLSMLWNQFLGFYWHGPLGYLRCSMLVLFLHHVLQGLSYPAMPASWVKEMWHWASSWPAHQLSPQFLLLLF